MAAHKKPAPAARHRRPVAWFLLADVLAAALLVFGNYYFLYEAPIRGLSGGSLSLPQVENNIQHSSHHGGRRDRSGAGTARQPAGKVCRALH